MAATMREVAARAGVSVKTVSRVVNAHPNISDDVRDRVGRAIRELDWRPNTHARSLRTGRTGVIAVSLPDLTAPTASRMLQELVTEAERQGLLVSIEPSHGRAGRVRQTLDAIGASFDGVIHVGPLPEGLDASSSAGPLVGVTTGEGPPEADGPASPDGPAGGYDLVDPDDAAAALAVVRHLQTLGRRAPVLLARPSGRADEYVRRLVAELPQAPVLRPIGAPDRAAGRELAARALIEHPDADSLVCADDELAIGALSLLLERGGGVPDPIAIVGHGDLEDTRFTTPALTTVDIGVAEIARRAVDLLRTRLEDDRLPLRRSIVPVALVRRESTLGTLPGGLPAGGASSWRG